MSTDPSGPQASAAVADLPKSHVSPTEEHVSAAANIEHVAAPIPADTAVAALAHGPRGALLIAGISVGLLFVG